MDPYWLGIIGLVLMVVMILLRVPISFALAGIGTVGLIMLYDFDMALSYIPYQLYSHISKFTFTAVPLFLLMGLPMKHMIPLGYGLEGCPGVSLSQRLEHVPCLQLLLVQACLNAQPCPKSLCLKCGRVGTACAWLRAWWPQLEG